MRLGERAPAKINLALHVRGRRPDGYHSIQTLFAFCEVGDELTGEAGEELQLRLQGPFAAGLAGEGRNLVLEAASALARAAGLAAGARLTLTKNLPVASGLGGGSADAAAALRLLNRLWGLNWPLEKLADIGGSVGADVPACVFSRMMRGEGVGEVLRPVAAVQAPVLLVNPGMAISTAEVFRAWDGVDGGALGDGDPMTAAIAGRNDLEAVAKALEPAVATTLSAMKSMPGAILTRMSGSGATCFTVFKADRDRDAAAAALAASHPGWWIAATRLQSS